MKIIPIAASLETLEIIKLVYFFFYVTHGDKDYKYSYTNYIYTFLVKNAKSRVYSPEYFERFDFLFSS